MTIARPRIYVRPVQGDPQARHFVCSQQFDGCYPALSPALVGLKSGIIPHSSLLQDGYTMKVELAHAYDWTHDALDLVVLSEIAKAFNFVTPIDIKTESMHGGRLTTVRLNANGELKPIAATCSFGPIPSEEEVRQMLSEVYGIVLDTELPPLLERLGDFKFDLKVESKDGKLTCDLSAELNIR